MAIDPEYFYKTGYLPTRAAFEYSRTGENPYSADLSVEYRDDLLDSPLMNAESSDLARRVKEQWSPLFGLEFDNTGEVTPPAIFVTNDGDPQGIINKFGEFMNCTAPTIPDTMNCYITYLGMFPSRGQVFRVIMTGRVEHLVEWAEAHGYDSSRMNRDGMLYETDIGYDIIDGVICHVTYTIRVDINKTYPFQDEWYQQTRATFLANVEKMYGATGYSIARDQYKIGISPDFPDGYAKVYYFVNPPRQQVALQH